MSNKLVKDELMNKNLKWIGLGTLVFLALAAMFALAFYLIMNLLKGEAYEMSLMEVERHPEVIEIVGAPMQPSRIVMGNISTSGPSGSASIQYGIKGPDGAGTVYVYATRHMGEWRLEQVVVGVKDPNKRITVVTNED